MSRTAKLGAHVRRRIETPRLSDMPEPTVTAVPGRSLRPRPVDKPSDAQVAARQRHVRLVVEDVETGETTVLSKSIPWRAIEILGSAANYYASNYNNPDRPADQVRARRDWAKRLGAAIWNIAEEKVGIQSPTIDPTERYR